MQGRTSSQTVNASFDLYLLCALCDNSYVECAPRLFSRPRILSRVDSHPPGHPWIRCPRRTHPPDSAMSEEYYPSLDDPTAWTPYWYHPSKAVGMWFVALFGLIALLHIFLGVPQTEIVFNDVSRWWDTYVPCCLRRLLVTCALTLC